MTPPGRKRKANPTLPRHIDPEKIPTGFYWDGRKGAGTWYVFNRKAGERPRRKNIASATATLADLHALAEARAGKTNSKVLRGLCEAFEDSPAFKGLGVSTQAGYTYCRDVVCEFRLANGGRFGDLVTKRITPPVIQGLIDALAKGTERDKETGELIATPSKAAHVQRYLRRLFRWGRNRGFNDINPAEEIEMPKERKRRRLPARDTLWALVSFARENAGGRGKKGSVAPYLWAAIVIGYRCRLRPIEVRTLTDAHRTEAGVQTNRRKGSRDNITEWSPDLLAAWDYLVALRQSIWSDTRADDEGRKRKRPRRVRAVPIRPEDRLILVNHVGEAIGKSTFSSAWRRMLASAVEAGILSDDQKFGAHDLKRRGITDTPGTRPEKQLSSGHKEEAMLDIYDYSLPVVAAAGSRDVKSLITPFPRQRVASETDVVPGDSTD